MSGAAKGKGAKKAKVGDPDGDDTVSSMASMAAIGTRNYAKMMKYAEELKAEAEEQNAKTASELEQRVYGYVKQASNALAFYESKRVEWETLASATNNSSATVPVSVLSVIFDPKKMPVLNVTPFDHTIPLTKPLVWKTERPSFQ